MAREHDRAVATAAAGIRGAAGGAAERYNPGTGGLEGFDRAGRANSTPLPPAGQWAATAASGAATGQGFSAELAAFMEAVGRIESGGRYNAVGPRTRYGRAYGKYQILESNWPRWAAEAGIPGASIRDPQAQERVARYVMMRYYQQFGRWDAVAVAWFAGPGRAKRYVQNPQSVSGVDDGNTTVPTYVAKVMSLMRRQLGVSPSAGALFDFGGQVWTPDRIREAGEALAAHFGLKVTSHHRSKEHNERVGGAKNSDHLWGGALDLSGPMENMMALARWAEQFTGDNGPFRIVLHPGNDAKHDDHVHISWHRNGSKPLQLPGPMAGLEYPYGENGEFAPGMHTFDTGYEDNPIRAVVNEWMGALGSLGSGVESSGINVVGELPDATSA